MGDQTGHEDPAATEPEAPHFFAAIVWGLLALATPVIAATLGAVVDYGGRDGYYSTGFKVVAVLMGLTCAAGFYFAWRTQKEAADLPWKRRLSYLTGAVSALMLLFWFVGTLALTRLGPYWR